MAVQSRRRTGFSRTSFSACRNSAAATPSNTLWSAERVTDSHWPYVGVFYWDSSYPTGWFPPMSRLEDIKPGAVPSTGLLRGTPRWIRAAITWPPFLKLLGVRVASAQQARQLLAHYTIAPIASGAAPVYYGGDSALKSSQQSYNETNAANLWESSQEWVRPHRM